jgi:hypothetical protein
MKKRFRILVTPITNSLEFRVKQMFIACCVLHNRLLDYNDVDNWRERKLAHKGEQDDYVPVSIDSD